MSEVTVSKVVLRLKGRNIELTPDEARAVHRELHDLLHRNPMRNVEMVPVPIVTPLCPIMIPYPDWTPPHWEITWGGGTGTGSVAIDVNC